MRITAHDGLLRDLTRVAVAGQAPGGQQALGYDLSSFSTSTFSLTWASLPWPRFAHGAFTPLPRVSPRSRLRQSWPLPRESVPHAGRRVTEQRRLRDGPRPPASLRVPHAAVLSRLGHRSRVPLRDTGARAQLSARPRLSCLSPETQLVTRPRRPLSPAWLSDGRRWHRAVPPVGQR